MSTAAAEFIRLIEIVARLRAPDGCPWDREQTIDSLKPFVLEETYEVLETIDRHDHAALARGARRLPVSGGLPRAARGRGRALHHRRLVQQHRRQAGAAPSARVRPRRRAKRALETAGQVRTRWEEIKAQERGAQAKPPTLLGGIPPTLPALLRAYHIGVRAASVGFDWTRAARCGRQDSGGGRRAARGRGGRARRPTATRAEEEMGDLLFSIANLVAQARDRTGNRAAQGERQVHAPLRSHGAVHRSVRAGDEGPDARGARTGVAAGEIRLSPN